MKYFVLKPAGDDAHATACRAAMRCYARHIHATNSSLADELSDWADAEEAASRDRLANPHSIHSVTP
jgi:hypothetical protein